MKSTNFSSFRHRIGEAFPSLRNLWSKIWGGSYHAMWALRSRLLWWHPITVRIGNSVIFMMPKGHIAKLMWGELFEKNERNFVESNIGSGMCVINVGANTGLYTLIAARLVGNDGVVHAFEPSSMNFLRLHKNTVLNDFKNVFLNQIALSDFSGVLEVMRDGEHPDLDSHYFVRNIDPEDLSNDSVEIIHCNTFDNYWRDVNQGRLRNVNLVIMDVEGAELQVLKGMSELLAGMPNLMLMIECTEKLDEIDLLLRSQGFSFFTWNPLAGSLERVQMMRGTIYAMRNDASDRQ